MADMADRYEMLEELGSGSFGTVYRAIEKATGEEVAVKHIDLESSDDDIQEIQGEIAVLSSCTSKFITRYKGCFVRGHKLWIIMEYMGGGSCLDILKPGPVPEQYVAIICRELLSGLEYLHREGKIHRDVKAANVLLAKSGEVKLADFGVAAQLSNIKSQRHTFVGTPFWMAPEVIQQEGYNTAADIWSLGITALEMAYGEPPNAAIHPMKVLFLIPKEPAPRLEGAYSKEFKEFAAACLNKDPEERPTATELLRYRFIQNAGSVTRVKEMIERKHSWDGARVDRVAKTRIYEDTIKAHGNPLIPAEDDGWIFDTIKPDPIAIHEDAQKPKSPLKENVVLDQINVDKHTQKRRKVTSPGKTEQLQDTLQELSINDNLKKSRLTMRKISNWGNTSVGNTAIFRPQDNQRKLLQRAEDYDSVSTKPSTTRTSHTASSSISDPFSDQENEAPGNDQETMQLSKEDLLGNRLFTNAIETASQEMYAETNFQESQDAIAHIADGFAYLNNVDPEGLLLLVKSMILKVEMDPKLAAYLLPPPPIPLQASNLSPNKQKLKLAASNPHLKSHKRRQSEQPVISPTESSPLSSKQLENLPGQEIPGMEHTKDIAEKLFARWSQDLLSRLPSS